ncbi:hypothetical protein G6011_03632 [Alternaria panax]|uniref:Uncharacterized protein n=1 Tax=Alternaria panax TaxID=48097 RepID=A0AAD4NT30_9PLEO|nr:hypothetical protein G6011_03632 [Alternaria panax]
MTRSNFRSPSRAPCRRSASPRHSRTTSPTQPHSPHQSHEDDDYGEGHDGEHWEPARNDTLGRFIADSPSPVGSPMEEDETILDADQLWTQLAREQFRSETARADSYVEQADKYEQRMRELQVNVTRLEAALTCARAELRQRDAEMFALEARPATVGLSSTTTTTHVTSNPVARVVKCDNCSQQGLACDNCHPCGSCASEHDRVRCKCGNYLQHRAVCGQDCNRVHVDDGVKGAKPGKEVREMMQTS